MTRTLLDLEIAPATLAGWGACWSRGQIAEYQTNIGAPTTTLGAALADPRITSIHRVWLGCAALARHDRSRLIAFALGCADAAEAAARAAAARAAANRAAANRAAANRAAGSTDAAWAEAAEAAAADAAARAAAARAAANRAAGSTDAAWAEAAARSAAEAAAAWAAGAENAARGADAAERGRQLAHLASLAGEVDFP